MNHTHLKYLFFVTKPYSFSILKPIQDSIIESNSGTVKWFSASSAVNFSSPGDQLKSNGAVLDYNPDVVLVPGNIVPHFWPGLKVQIFHGLDEEVKGFYNITGFFDLYCTTGPVMTENYLKIAKQKKHFLVKETGWPKLDPVYNNKWTFNDQKSHLIDQYDLNPELPVLLYAPTFPLKYTSASDLHDSIKNLNNGKFNWIIKFHPLMDKLIQGQYKQLENKNLRVVDELNILPIMAGSDLLITDTSSVAYEFLSFDRPLITYKAIARKDKGINIQDPTDLSSAIERSLMNPDEFSMNRASCLRGIHPYLDGLSSSRLLKVIEIILTEGLHNELKQKPLNFLRKYQIRKIIARSEA
ncbi:CDP-glycerol glycerophosphotransferase family protein [bacterium]|nr:CDP-glycerol glycerophosphotransferase family protein [Candidatus Neomarinimicrobiota bacterium]MDC0645762.1 CDP-glycerol glycerophosphotransferase family protein [bacterium]MDC1037872.1 CDP-glycerol glycerophosphotransferase family protein [Candidatus Neomarinimicrobiota bacterium]